MVIPLEIAVRYRWLIRIGLAGYAVTTITAWLIDPIFYQTAYLAKGIEVALIALLAIDFFRRDGNPLQRIRDEIQSLTTRPRGPASGRPEPYRALLDTGARHEPPSLSDRDRARARHRRRLRRRLKQPERGAID
jgi:hypothetical protein